MNCEEARAHLLDHQRGRTAAALRDDVRAHLAGCAACGRLATEEQVLDELLEQRLPQYPASLALKRRLAEQWPSAVPSGRARWSRWAGWRTVPALAVAGAILVFAPLVYHGVATRNDARARVVGEAVNDHLRVITSQRPVEVASGGIHQVKPWFAGRLDFAPVVGFEGDADVTLQGGAVGYFLDRKAAIFIYKVRLHTISLLVLPAKDLSWPASPEASRSRGFSVVLWRSGDLGYALVSDVETGELTKLAAKIAATTSS